jgi:predicted RNA-binding Zn ribbon-like protein
MTVPVASDPHPGTRSPAGAPGTVDLLAEFINTADLESGTEEIGSAPALSAWLVGHGLLGRGRRVTPQDEAMALELREALRDLLEGNSGRLVPADAVARFDHVAAAVPLRVSFNGGAHLEPEPMGTGPVLGRLLGLVYRSVADGSWSRLKVCRNGECRYAFYDGSRNRSGTWCSMATCGNRMKGRAFRARQRGAA